MDTVNELIAEGDDRHRRAWRGLPEGQVLMLGRAARSELEVPWDRMISREHAEICIKEGRLLVHCLASARNPILLSGHEASDFTISPHGAFRIGHTNFRFELANPPRVGAAKVVEHTMTGGPSAGAFGHAQACLQALCEMPTLIADARDDGAFAARVCELLLRSMPTCLAVAVVQFEPDADSSDAVPEPKLIRWDCREGAVAGFKPSRRLMCRAFQQQQSVVHLWSPEKQGSDYTMASDLDWAFCTPIPTDAAEKWCLYVSGRRQFRGLPDVQSPNDLFGDLRLAELMARFIGAVRQIRVLEKHQAEMRQFLSPAVVEALMSKQGWESLDPRQGAVAVLFCDVRGFSQLVEECQAELSPLLSRVREALSAMTRSILKFEGVIADFQGDSALGFWGWPAPVEDAALLACRAALTIQSEFAAADGDSNHPLHGFRVGVGIGLGKAIAGRIGSNEQIKVGVFGPVVNRTSRLQELTKLVRTPILVDGAVAEAAGAVLPADEAIFRRVGWIRPAGISTAVNVHALVRASEAEHLSRAQSKAFEQAVSAFESGRWANAKSLLDKMPANDGLANLLKLAIEDYGGSPPAGWEGALTLADKTSDRRFAAHAVVNSIVD